MQFCKECGHKLEESAKFCKECGTSIAGAQRQPSGGNIPPTFATKKQMSKKQKKTLIAIGIAALVLFGAFKSSEALTSKDRLIDRFETALNEKDSKKVAGLLSSTDTKLTIDENSVKGFMTYLNKDPNAANELVNGLRSQSTYMDKADEKGLNELAEYFGEGLLDNSLVNLKKDGKFLFFDTYKLMIPSVYLELSTNYQNTELFIDGKKVGKASTPSYTETFGPLVPGIHKTEARLKTKYVDLKTNDEIFLRSGKESNHLTLDGQDLRVKLPNDGDDIDSAKLFINGKDVGIDLLQNPSFGPILTDGSMKMHVEAKMPWGLVKTDDVPIMEAYMPVNFVTSDLQKTIKDTVLKYLDEELQVFTTGDASKFTTAGVDMKERILSLVDDAKSNNTIYKGSLLSTKIDLDSFYLENNYGIWNVSLIVNPYYFDGYFHKGDEPNLSENSNTLQMKLSYDPDEKNWLVENYSSTWGSDGNIKEFKNENPVVYVSSWLN